MPGPPCCRTRLCRRAALQGALQVAAPLRLTWAAAADIQLPEVRAFYGFQIAIENVHSEMYSLLLDHYVKDRGELEHLLHGIQTIPCVEKKAKWAQRWIGSARSFAERLVRPPFQPLQECPVATGPLCARAANKDGCATRRCKSTGAACQLQPACL